MTHHDAFSHYTAPRARVEDKQENPSLSVICHSDEAAPTGRTVPEAAFLRMKVQLRSVKSDLRQALQDREQLRQMTGYLVEELAKERSAK